MGLFGECQFLVSTHSPQVLGGVAAEHIRLLKSDEEGRVEVTQPLASKGRDSNYVLEGVLETEEQDPEVDRLFGEFERLMDAAKFDEADRCTRRVGCVGRRRLTADHRTSGEVSAPAADGAMRGAAKGEEPEDLQTWKARTGQRRA